LRKAAVLVDAGTNTFFLSAGEDQKLEVGLEELLFGAGWRKRKNIKRDSRVKGEGRKGLLFSSYILHHNFRQQKGKKAKGETKTRWSDPHLRSIWSPLVTPGI